MSKINGFIWGWATLIFGAGILAIRESWSPSKGNDNTLLILGIIFLCIGCWLIIDFIWKRLEFFENEFLKVFRCKEDEEDK